MRYRFKNEIIENFLSEKQMTIARFIRECRLSIVLFHRIMRGDFKVGVEYFMRMAQVMEIPFCLFFEEVTE